MASGSNDRDALSKLLQMGTVAEYQSEFEVLINRVSGISENLLKSFYISGLKPALQCALLRSNPTTLGEVFSLARAMEARFTDIQLWELLRSNPTTLREALSLARTTEAYLEDQWPITTIAKPSDVNSGEPVDHKVIDHQVPIKPIAVEKSMEESNSHRQQIPLVATREDGGNKLEPHGRVNKIYDVGHKRKLPNVVLEYANYGQPWQRFLMHFMLFSYNPKEGELQVKVWDPGVT